MKSAKTPKPSANTHSYSRLPSDSAELFRLDDLDEASAPPIRGKVHPRSAMDDVVPTLDDSDRQFLHHPNDSVSEGFSFDPESADAAADLAGELGADFVEGATNGRDMSDVMLSEEEENVIDETPYVVETMGDGSEEPFLPEDEFEDSEVPPDEPRAFQVPRARYDLRSRPKAAR